MANKNKSPHSILLLSVLLLIFVWLVSTIPFTRNNPLVFLTFLLSFAITAIGIFSEKRKFSLNKAYWYFSLFFMIIAPLIQYATNYDVWGYHLDDDKYINLNLFILLFNIVFFAIYKIRTKKKLYSEKTEESTKQKTISKRLCLTLVIISVICFALSIYFIGFNNLFIRDNNSLSIDDNTLNSILTKLLRVFPAYASACSILHFQKEKKGIPYIIISLAITLLLNFPTSVNRYWMGTIYLGLSIITFKEKFRSRTFDYLIMLIFLFIFPLFQTFKWNSLSDLISGDVSINGFVASYDNADFDAYSMFGRIIDYTNDSGFLKGNQLGGSALFIIPRKIWPEKPIPSGELVATAQKQTFTDLACPIMAEGYVDFGTLGVIIYAFVIATICSLFDKKFWDKTKTSIIEVIYPFMIGLLLFTLRGALHPAVVFIFIFYVPAMVYSSLVHINKQLIQRRTI